MRPKDVRSVRFVVSLILLASTAACASRKYRSEDVNSFRKTGTKQSRSNADPTGLFNLMSGDLPDKIEAPKHLTMLDRSLTKFDPREGNIKTSKPFHFRVHTAFLDEVSKRVWVGGALYSQNSIYRSFLIFSDGEGRWFEAAPANAGLSFVHIEKNPAVGLVVAESLFSEGSALSSFWNFNISASKWSEQQILQKSKSDVFKKNIGCCTEIILDLSFTNRQWKLNLAGDEKSANFVSKDQGRSWQLVGKPESFSLAKEKGIRQWIASPTDLIDEPENPMILVEFSNGDKPYQIPRFWDYEAKGTTIRLKPLLK